MSLRIMDFRGNLLGVLRIPASVRVSDLESLRKLGAHRIELINARNS